MARSERLPLRQKRENGEILPSYLWRNTADFVVQQSGHTWGAKHSSSLKVTKTWVLLWYEVSEHQAKSMFCKCKPNHTALPSFWLVFGRVPSKRHKVSALRNVHLCRSTLTHVTTGTDHSGGHQKAAAAAQPRRSGGQGVSAARAEPAALRLGWHPTTAITRERSQGGARDNEQLGVRFIG